MVKIRLRRVGATKRPSYRIVAADSRSPRDGRFLEILGHYDPLTEPATVVVKEDRVRYWVEHGAQPTDTVARLFSQRGVLSTTTTVAEPEVSVQEPAPVAEAVSPTIEEAVVEAEQPRRTVRRRATTVAEPEVSVQEPAPVPEAVSPTIEEAAVETERPRRTVRRRTTAAEPTAAEAEQPRRTVRRRTTAAEPAAAEAEQPRRTTRRRATAEQPESQTGTGEGAEAKQESGDGV